uniref:Uncharacterized protein n=1 Tax=Ditylenchus dipsaci TaxID=166011 RepID=A0A915E950_9BILA
MIIFRRFLRKFSAFVSNNEEYFDGRYNSIYDVRNLLFKVKKSNMNGSLNFFQMDILESDGRSIRILMEIKLIKQDSFDFNNCNLASSGFARCPIAGLMSLLPKVYCDRMYMLRCQPYMLLGFNSALEMLKVVQVVATQGPEGIALLNYDELHSSVFEFQKELSIKLTEHASRSSRMPDYVMKIVDYSEADKMYQYTTSRIQIEAMQSFKKKSLPRYIVYVLFDPSFLVGELPNTLSSFMSSIYYVGSGMPGRPFEHVRNFLNADPTRPMSLLLMKIRELYAMDRYVMLPVCTNLYKQKSLLFETCIIELLCSGGRNQLLNRNRGHNIFRNRSSGEHAHYGAYLLEDFGYPKVRELLDFRSMIMF